MAQPPPQFYGQQEQYHPNQPPQQWAQGQPNTFDPNTATTQQGSSNGGDVSFDFGSMPMEEEQQQQTGTMDYNNYDGSSTLHHRQVPHQQGEPAATPGSYAGFNQTRPDQPTTSTPSTGPSIGNMFNPAQAMGTGGDALLNHFVQQGTQHFVQQGSQIMSDPNVVMKYIPGLALFYSSLKYYFNVSNSYVKNKLILLLFPFRHKRWMRERASQDGDSGARMAPPVTDLNAPDLYIPSMAFISYILLVGVLQGINSKFSPEVLQHTFNSSITTTVLEVLVLKVAMYFLAPAVPLSWLDLTVYSAYKYVGVSLNLVVGLTLGVMFYNIVLCYTGGCMAFFVYKTMERVIPEPSIDHSGRKRRIYLLVMFAVLQFMSMWWLGYTRDFKSAAVMGGIADTEILGGDDGLEVGRLSTSTTGKKRGVVTEDPLSEESDYN